MKKLIFLSAFFMAQVVSAQADKCSLRNDQIPKPDCQMIDQAGQCKEAPPVDENALRNKISGLIKISEDPERIKRLTTNWTNETRLNPWQVKMYAERTQYEIQEKLPPMPILDYFSDPKFAPSAKSKEVYKEAFINKYIDFAKKMDCSPTFKLSDNYVEPHPTLKGFTAENMGREEREFRLRNLRADMAKPENVKAVQDRMKQISDESPSRMLICSEKPELDARYKVAERFQPCAGNFKKNFENNKYEVPQTDLAKLMASPEADDLSKCIKDRLAQGAKLHHISINSSASSLNNTGDAEKKFCKKGFANLSAARAQSARNQILPGLFEKAGYSGFDLAKANVQINSNGANGDGTSGPCVYETKNGKEVLKPYYSTKAGKEELDENRYVKVQVTFEDTTKKANENIPIYQPMYRCKKIDFKCEG